jgi:NAD-dependent protein deacetylase/lipoamidase
VSRVDGLDEARALLEPARTVCVLAGAGISTASGIPDFRGPEGIWTKDPAAEMLSSYDVWVRDVAVRRHAWRRRVEARGERPQPNDGHRALVTLERSGRLDTLVTQNVDGLHHEAGSDPRRIVEIHGSSRDVLCLRCGDRGPIDVVLDRVAAGDDVPACLVATDDGPCGGILKSAVISFGQSLIEADLARAEAAAARCDVLLAVGSTLSVWPIAGLVPLAHAKGAAVVVVNGSPTAMDDLAAARVGGAIEAALPALVADLPAP